MSDEQEKVSVVGDPNEEVANTEEVKEEETTTEEDKTIEEDIVEDLVEQDEVKDDTVPTTEEPAPAIDISKLSVEQLQALKSALDTTPDRASTADKSKEVKVRKIGDKYVIDFKPAYLTYAMDETQQRKVERHMIPVKLEGETEFTDMPYKHFMGSEQVVCKVLAMPKEDRPIIEGETYDEHDRLVEMVRMEVIYTLKIKTPEGRELSIEGKIANA